MSFRNISWETPSGSPILGLFAHVFFFYYIELYVRLSTHKCPPSHGNVDPRRVFPTILLRHSLPTTLRSFFCKGKEPATEGRASSVPFPCWILALGLTERVSCTITTGLTRGRQKSNRGSGRTYVLERMVRFMIRALWIRRRDMNRCSSDTSCIAGCQVLP